MIQVQQLKLCDPPERSILEVLHPVAIDFEAATRSTGAARSDSIHWPETGFVVPEVSPARRCLRVSTSAYARALESLTRFLW